MASRISIHLTLRMKSVLTILNTIKVKKKRKRKERERVGGRGRVGERERVII